MRPSKREPNQLRPISLTRHYTKHAEGSVLVEFGDTKVICTASVVSGVPNFLRGKDQGWLTAEYGMLPGSTHERSNREAARGRQSGRTMEIQRLIGRALRQCIDLKKVGENTIHVDCDVIQADGGTRTASITGACLALHDAVTVMQNRKSIKTNPFIQFIAAISVGVYQGQVITDLDYAEDHKAETDMNLVMTEQGEFIEIQGTAEGMTFSQQQLTEMLALGKESIAQLIQQQKASIT